MRIFKKAIMPVIIAMFVVMGTYKQVSAASNLEVHFIDADNGECVYIELPDGTDILIDAGTKLDGSKVVQYLKQQESDMDIEHLIVTNLGNEHIEGLMDVFPQMNVKNFYYPHDISQNSTGFDWNEILKLATAEGCNILDVENGYELFKGENLTVKFINTFIDYEGDDNKDDSAVVLVDYKDVEMLFMGDVQENVEQDILHYEYDLPDDVEILKASDKASQNTSSQSFLDKVSPKHTIISGAESGMNQNTLDRIKGVGSEIWTNDKSGNIVVKTDGSNYTISDDTQKVYKSSGWKKIDGKWYYFEQDTKQTGWVQDSGKWYYLNDNGVMQTGWLNLDGYWYYLESSGVMTTGWKQLGERWYYLNDNGVMATGWVESKGKWYYLNDSGVMATGWLNSNGIWYYLNNSGVMATGWLNLNGRWYYLNDSGVMATDWLYLNDKRYYLGTNGVMATGWVNQYGDWYYLKPSGVMATGWLNLKNRWYYLDDYNGAMKTEWLDLDGNRYYLGTNGVMTTGWINQYGYWYYLKPNGAMATGWLNLNGRWYYLNEYTGAMTTGWLDCNGTSYYLDYSGAMATNTYVDGYYIDENGVATYESYDEWDDGYDYGYGYDLPDDTYIYVTPNGHSYHIDSDCSTLSRSNTIIPMTVGEAKARGKSDPCNVCIR